MNKILNILSLITLSIFVISCGADPCEGVSCVNGDCIDGSCACDPGWKGEFCDEVDFNFIGDYTAKSFTFSDCDDSSHDGTVNVDALDNFCYNDGDKRVCFNYTLVIRSDGTFFQRWLDHVTEGGFTITERETAEGTYEISGSMITLCSADWTDCSVMEVNSRRSGLDWTFLNRNSRGCLITYSVIKD